MLQLLDIYNKLMEFRDLNQDTKEVCSIESEAGYILIYTDGEEKSYEMATARNGMAPYYWKHYENGSPTLRACMEAIYAVSSVYNLSSTVQIVKKYISPWQLLIKMLY